MDTNPNIHLEHEHKWVHVGYIPAPAPGRGNLRAFACDCGKTTVDPNGRGW